MSLTVHLLLYPSIIFQSKYPLYQESPILSEDSFYIFCLLFTDIIYNFIMIDLVASITSSTIATVALYPIERLKI